ncbi:hypothetical protein BDV96DRAFT_580347 [Lophiotrema nucula]|uniref:Uncharacterized protein n=1 Tax=Lophiotrema nucula TaxID=690887 RepID=A0A6A5Z169_9PLEO|nr:hypothetical protein BDV96DRAFT_580347 [Lophiotrema nucula]
MKSFVFGATILASYAFAFDARDIIPRSISPDLIKRQIVDPNNPTVNPEDPQCEYYCDKIAPIEGMPLITEAQYLGNVLKGMDPNARVAISRDPGSTDPAYTTLISSGDTEINIFFNDNERMRTAYYAEFYIQAFGDFVQAITEVCGPYCGDDRVFGSTDVPNCRHIDGTLKWYPDGIENKPGTYPGIRIEVGRVLSHGDATSTYWRRNVTSDGKLI